VFFHWKTLNRRFGICASNKFLSHASPEINDGRDFISFPWSLSQVQMGLRWMDGGSRFDYPTGDCLNSSILKCEFFCSNIEIIC
jgi:hypothetical protein